MRFPRDRSRGTPFLGIPGRNEFALRQRFWLLQNTWTRCRTVCRNALLLSLYPDLEAVSSCHRMLDRDGVLDLQQAAPLAEVVPQGAGLDIHRQLPVGGLIQGRVLPPLLKHHLGVHTAHPAQDHLGPADLKGGGRPLHA
ncbi:VapD family protein, partial [Dysosmobacter welbionis]